ncbi:hypothetical protein SEA_GAIL_44 [Mycobacterium phage Gail]|uniref:Uncharacterized protein n=1 Tax=Mycobacterium phage Gail TaxID=2743994 RepID=A0A7D5FTI0_9CAUD|nr:hypothetical protein KNV16_gp065 [Mycobacterium phage Gail]QLF84608.1 hypothetical protein SEA_GAIL_44 [Mycobacterium phage Gail]
MKVLKQIIPVTTYGEEFSLATGPHGPRVYQTLETARTWREVHGMQHLWKFLELTVEEGEEPKVRWVE